MSSKEKTKAPKTLADFSNDREAIEEAIWIKENSSNIRPLPRADLSNGKGENQPDDRLNALLEQKLAEFLEKAGIRGCKSPTKKGNKQTGYVQNEQWAEFLTYRKRSDERFNETMKTILWFAKKYRESLRGGVE